MNNKPILVVDDEPDLRELLRITIERMGHQVICAADVNAAKNAIDAQPISLCLTDMQMPDGNGHEVLQYCQAKQADAPVAVITAFGNTDLAVESLKLGAFDFISKPVDVNRLRTLIEDALALPQQGQSDDSTSVAFIGESDAADALRRQVKKLARSQAPIFISGESGSGKEVIARLIHASGPRAHAPFIPVNCGAIPNELLESELFGHVKGSFTGATANKKGLFEAAEGGTLFLDEVADLSLDAQVKLLRAIQEKSVRPVGANEEIAVNVRVLSASHKHLMNEVDSGRFRHDLYYRLNVIEMLVPPLRERKEDIPVLAQWLLDKRAKDWQVSAPNFNEASQNALKQYDYPGNVRELENVVERALALCDGNSITAEDLQLPGQMPVLSSTAENTSTPTVETASAASPETEAGHFDMAKGDMEAYLSSIEQGIIAQALEQCRWNRTEAAKLLGVSTRQLRYRLDKLGLNDHAED